MKTQPDTLTRLLGFCLVLLVGLLFSGCKPYCTELPEEAPEFITDIPQWWMTSTTDNIDINNHNSLLFSFTATFTGSITAVRQNQPSQEPEITFVYDIFPDQRLIIAELTRFDGTPIGTFRWAYNLGRVLTIQDIDSGAVSKFIPYEGVVKPGFDCRFPE